MAAKYILAVAAVVFLAAGALRRGGHAPAARAQSHTWLLIGVIFAIVSVWLFWRG